MKFSKSRDDNISEKKSKNKKSTTAASKKKYIAVATVMLAAVLILSLTCFGGGFETIDHFLFYRHRVIDASVVSTGSFPVSFTNNDIISCEKMSSKMIVLTKKMLTCVSYKGRVLYTEPFTFVEPQMYANDDYGVLFDRGSSKYIIFNAYGIVYEGVTQDNRHIITATVDAKGNCAVATKSDDSACRVYLINKNGEIKYIWSCAEEYAVALDISNDGKNILCGTIGSYNDEVYSEIYYLDMYSDNGETSFKITGSACCNVFFKDKNSAIVDCVDKRVIFDLRTSDGSPVEVNFSGETALMDWDSNGNLAVVTDKLNSIGVNEVTLYDKNNSVVFRDEVSENALDILCAGGKVYCLTDESVIEYSESEESDMYVCDIIGNGLVELKGKVYYHSSGRVMKAF